MEAAMEIVSDRTDNILTISVAGRLDAFEASQLDEAIKKLVTDDDFFVVIDMGNVPYLSSGGIRTLLATEKMLKRRDGGVHLCNVNEYPRKVLEMAGFDQLFPIHSTKEQAFKRCVALEAMRQAEKDWHHLPTYQNGGARFTVFESPSKEAILKVVGNISNTLFARLEEGDIFSRRFSETEYSIGLGAMGKDVKDCIHILGEMITVGGTMVCLPTNGSDTPDFLIPRRDTGEVMFYTGFNVALSGEFNDIIAVESEGDAGLTMNDLYTSIFEIARGGKARFRGVVSLAMIADTGGVYSSGVKISPIKEFAPENGKSIMHEDNSDRWLDLNVVPKYKGNTMVSFGIGIDLTSDLSSFVKDALDALFYLPQVNIANAKTLLHNHGVIFEHVPWKRQLNLDEEIKKIVTDGTFVDMRHLLGRTAITRAIIGVSYISDIIFEEAKNASRQ
jgi:anti-anti-sigma factor